ncbi:conserved hypothetical protein [Ricinus communis]|uniref:Uncharacterized protein n=1 Tax=Ricinus communis TaxID=3988 RepID=B9S5M0_RICCO|nr:conserved hypothetical protein [Ricinus communis]
MVNVEPKGYFSRSRGVHQGTLCPLFSFAFGEDFLSRWIAKKVSEVWCYVWATGELGQFKVFFLGESCHSKTSYYIKGYFQHVSRFNYFKKVMVPWKICCLSVKMGGL